MTTPEMELGMQSYPPALLVGGPVSASRMRSRIPSPAGGQEQQSLPTGDGSQPTSPRLTVTAGAPGGYSPAVKAVDRPRNVTELADRAQLVDPAPWVAGAYVPVGVSGKRAHWTGTEWKGGESPGYTAAPAVDPPVQLTETPQFPGDGDDSPGDLSR